MKLQKIGGVASIANAFLAAMWLVLIVVLFPRLGLAAPDDCMNPVKGIHAWAASPITFLVFDLEYILFSITWLLTVLAFKERMQADSPILTQVALIATAISCALWIAAGIVAYTGKLPIISAGDSSAYRAIMTVYFGLSNAGDHVYGWTFLIVAWVALKTAKLPRTLGCLLILIGLIFLFDFLSAVLGVIGLGILVIVSLWIGIVLIGGKQ